MNVWGAQIRPPSFDRALAAWLLNHGLMGRAERAFFEGAIRPAQFIVDVGANQGVFTMLFSKLVGPEGRVVALEPEPRLFAALDANCRLNDAGNVTRVQVAAGRTRADGVLHCSRFNSGDNRLTDSMKGDSVTVPVVPLDDVLPTETVSLVKIDVQGYELQVVEGMQAMMARSPEIRVLFEYWPEALAHAGCKGSELLDSFLDRGFSLCELSKVGLRKLAGADLMAVKSMSGRRFINLLAIRENAADGVR